MNITQFLGIAQLIAKLLEDGKITKAVLGGFLRQNGATDEQLSALDVRLTDAIDRRESDGQ